MDRTRPGRCRHRHYMLARGIQDGETSFWYLGVVHQHVVIPSNQNLAEGRHFTDWHPFVSVSFLPRGKQDGQDQGQDHNPGFFPLNVALETWGNQGWPIPPSLFFSFSDDMPAVTGLLVV